MPPRLRTILRLGLDRPALGLQSRADFEATGRLRDERRITHGTSSISDRTSSRTWWCWRNPRNPDWAGATQVTTRSARRVA